MEESSPPAISMEGVRNASAGGGAFVYQTNGAVPVTVKELTIPTSKRSRRNMRISSDRILLAAHNIRRST